jgi:adenosylmethionine-8-amino-7-oxononanoate aminotransferase
MQNSTTGREANEWLDADRRIIWHPFTPLSKKEPPLYITGGRGAYLFTHDGRSILDAVSSWWVNLHGHGHPEIARAVAAQAETLEHVIFAGFTHKPAIELAEHICSSLPFQHGRIFFSDNGSTAVEVALKIALQYWYILGREKRKVVALKGAYHGDTFGSMAVGERGIFTRPFHQLLFEVAFIDFPASNTTENVLQQFMSTIDGGDVACFIYEPLVQAAGGMRMYAADVLDRMLGYAQDKNVLCIADEVFTGFGRTGRMFASEYVKRRPDLIALSKGLTGGTLPLGVTAVSQRVYEAFEGGGPERTFYHGHSYTANPIACAAANASYRLLQQRDCQTSIARISRSHADFVMKIHNHRRVRDARSLGTILAVEVEAGETRYDNQIADDMYSYFLDRGILLRPLGNVIYTVPPYIITEEDCQRIYSAITDFLDQL